MKDVNKNFTWVQNRTHTLTDGIISVELHFDKVFLQKYILCSSFSFYYFYCNKIFKRLMFIKILSEQSSEKKNRHPCRRSRPNSRPKYFKFLSVISTWWPCPVVDCVYLVVFRPYFSIYILPNC